MANNYTYMGTPQYGMINPGAGILAGSQQSSGNSNSGMQAGMAIGQAENIGPQANGMIQPWGYHQAAMTSGPQWFPQGQSTPGGAPVASGLSGVRPSLPSPGFGGGAVPLGGGGGSAPGSSGLRTLPSSLGRPSLGSLGPVAPAGPQPSVAAQALGGARAGQISSYLTALNQAGAGSNNAQMTSNPGAQAAAPQLLGQAAASNGSAGGLTYQGGFNGGQNQVSYNSGLGAQGAASSYYNAQQPQGPVNYGGMSSSGGYSDLVAHGSGGSMFGGSNQLQAQQAPSYQWGGQTAPSNSQQPQMQAGYGANYSANYGGAQQQPAQQQQTPSYSYAGSRAVNDRQSPMTGAMQQQQSAQNFRPAAQQSSSYMMSDESQKTEITKGDPALTSFLSTIGVHEYSYKNKKHGEGRFVSPMAQELEQTELGKSAVVNTPEGKMVNYGRLAGVQLSGLAMVHEKQTELDARLARLEKNLRRRS